MSPFSPLYEIHTAVFLKRLSESNGREINLGDVPDSEISKLVDLGIKSIWLMGVWSRSQTAREIALNDSGFRDELEKNLPGFKDDDLIGSAYSISSYHVDPRFGDDEGLLSFRKRLNAAGIKLILDYVPNHVALDNDWTREHDHYFIIGSDSDAANHPDSYTDISGRKYALGRDPTFPAWTDVVQLNAFADGYRRQSAETINNIAALCDGVRCDMAMLMLNKVFATTWGDKAGKMPEEEYWSSVIGSVRKNFPTFCFIAEAYWDTEEELIQLGFDYCYDKQLYDYLRDGIASSAARHIKATAENRSHYLAFTENHDEVRASSIFNKEQAAAALAIVLSLPGIALIYDGQLEGNKIKIPVHVDRALSEETDIELYGSNIALLNAFKNIGSWSSWRPYDSDAEEIVGSIITAEDTQFVVLINYSPEDAQHDLIDSNSFSTGKDLFNDELLDLSHPIMMDPWQVRIIELSSD